MPNNQNKTRMFDQIWASVLNAVEQIAQSAIIPYGIHHHLHYKCLSIKLVANAKHRSPMANHISTSTKNNDEPCDLNVSMWIFYAWMLFDLLYVTSKLKRREKKTNQRRNYYLLMHFPLNYAWVHFCRIFFTSADQYIHFFCYYILLRLKPSCAQLLCDNFPFLLVFWSNKIRSGFIVAMEDPIKTKAHDTGSTLDLSFSIEAD